MGSTLTFSQTNFPQHAAFVQKANILLLLENPSAVAVGIHSIRMWKGLHHARDVMLGNSQMYPV
jgi:hypothetical protein